MVYVIMGAGTGGVWEVATPPPPWQNNGGVLISKTPPTI